MEYAVIDKKNERPFKGALFKAFFPALLTLNISFLLANNEFIRVLVTGHSSGDLADVYTALIAVFYIASGIAMSLFSPIWILKSFKEINLIFPNLSLINLEVIIKKMVNLKHQELIAVNF